MRLLHDILSSLKNEVFMKTKEVIQITKNLKLLYVEDDDVARNSTSEMLGNFFCDITTAIDGQDALDKFHNSTFDLILSDINMPKLDGITLLKEIREVNTNIPVLFLSAHNEKSYYLDATKLGLDGYILKPIELDQLVLNLTNAVKKITLQNENI